MNAPSISLLIPCYNAAAFLPALQTCIQQQQLAPSEVIAYDDGSTDKTAEVAEALGIRCLRGGKNQGAAAARNAAARAASGEWIHFCDADDPFPAEHLSTLARFCTTGRDVVTCDADWVSTSGETLLRWRYDAEKLASTPAAYLLGQPMSLTNSLIRKTAWDKVGGCDERLRMWEDGDVHFRMARAGAKFHHVAKVLSISVRRPESLSHDYASNWRWRLQCLEAYWQTGLDASLREVWLDELGKAAGQLLSLGRPTEAAAALALARRAGARLPSTRHPVLAMLGPLVSDLTLLRLQNWRRAQ
jgi:glycosyltransferase involved in cell wall biosynthesis